MAHYHVIFRACDTVFSVNKTARPFELDKTTLIQICFLSLIEALEPVEYTIYILGDKLSNKLQEFFKQFPVILTNQEMGVHESKRRSFEIALTYPDSEWVYFCEDDYLHRPETFIFIDQLIYNRDIFLATQPRPLAHRFLTGLFKKTDLPQKPLIIHPADYPDRYYPGQRRFSLLFLSAACHWRQISNTTHTLVTQVSTVRKWFGIFERSSYPPGDTLLSRRLYARQSFYGKALCLSPVPGLATHMHQGVMTPLVNWEPLYQRYRKQLKTFQG